MYEDDGRPQDPPISSSDVDIKIETCPGNLPIAHQNPDATDADTSKQVQNEDVEVL